MVIVMLLSVLVAVPLVGCGDSDDDATGGTVATTTEDSSGADSGNAEGDESGDAPEGDSSPIGKAEFIKKADAICYQTSKEIAETTSNALAKYANKPAALKEEIADIVPTLFVPRVEQQVEELRALGSPPGDEEQVEAFLDALQGVADLAEEDPEAFANADFTAPAKNPYQEADELADEYGFKSCPRV